MRHPTRIVALMLLVLCWHRPASADSDVICTGDCNYDSTVAIDELLTGVAITLGHRAIDTCRGFDLDGDGTIGIDELIGGVDNLLRGGCHGARFVPEDCTVPLPDGQDPKHARCGELIVPEDRAAHDGRTLRLAVAVLAASGPSPASDPVVFLGGGPGDAVLDGLFQTMTAAFAAPLQAARDLVFLDQRGAGRSTPSLACPEWQQAYVDNFTEARSIAEDGQRLVDAMRVCHDRLVNQGANVAAYTSTAIVADIADLMAALRYQEWNLYGFSYGSRVALTAMRELPQKPHARSPIRSVVLDSSVALQATLEADFAANAERGLNTMLAACAGDPGCNAAYPDLEQTLFTLVDRMNASPVTVHPTDPDGHQLTVVVTGDLFLLGVLGALPNDTLLPFLPALIAATAAGDRTLLTFAAGVLVGGGI